MEFIRLFKNSFKNKLIENLKGKWKLNISNKIKTKSDRKHYEKLEKFLRIKKDSIFIIQVEEI